MNETKVEIDNTFRQIKLSYLNGRTNEYESIEIPFLVHEIIFKYDDGGSVKVELNKGDRKNEKDR